MNGSCRNIAICHLDLGLGGAERFIVDSALELQGMGHKVHVYTSHYDSSRCLEDTSQLDIRVVGGWLPRTILGLFTVLCSLLRMFAIALHITMQQRSNKQKYDIIIVDQVSSIVSFLKRFTSAQIIFYGHFPDLLLAKHSSKLHAAYRAPFNRLEASSTAAAHVLLVNSNFTRDTFRDTFPKLRARTDIRVLYPAVSLPSDEELKEESATWESDLEPELVNWINGGSMLLSLNRFERKKNIALALRALREVIDRHAMSSGACSQARLIVAGGHDPRVRENVIHARELQRLAEDLNLEDRVVFLKNVTEKQRRALLAACNGVLYTPDKEHFGIVPLEAMARGRPVIAVATGGPLETIIHRETGFLSEGVPMDFANAVVLLLTMKRDAALEMASRARAHVAEKFSRSMLRDKWREVLNRVGVLPTGVLAASWGSSGTRGASGKTD